MKKYRVMWFNYWGNEDAVTFIIAKSKWDALRIFYIYHGDLVKNKKLVDRIVDFHEDNFITMEEAVENRARKEKSDREWEIRRALQALKDNKSD